MASSDVVRVGYHFLALHGFERVSGVGRFPTLCNNDGIRVCLAYAHFCLSGQPGHYKVTATSAGFGKVEATGPNLLVGQTVRIESVEAGVAQVVEQVAVQGVIAGLGNGVDLAAGSLAELDRVVGGFQNLPVNARNWSTFFLLTPNVTQDGGSGLVSVHGLLTQPIHQQQFGGSVCGPFIKDKLFYFFTYDGFRRVGRVLCSDTNDISLTPTAGNTGGTVISPTQCPSTITSQMCNAGITFLMQVANIEPGQASPSRYAKQDLFFPRIDYHINGKNDAFVDFNFANFSSTNGYSPASTFTNSSPSINGPTTYHERFLAVQPVIVLTPETQEVGNKRRRREELP
jgi:hypothetical protein